MKHRSINEISTEYRHALRWPNRHKELEPLLNDFECSLSGDFKNYNLDQLNESLKWFNNLAGMKDDRETISPSESQRKARDYLWFRIEQEKNKDDRVKVGDVFHSSWGYEQTNTEFYMVVEISKTGKTCKVVQVASETIGDEKEIKHDMCASIIPNTKSIIDKRKQTVKVERYHMLNPWTNKVEEIGEIQLRGSVFFSSRDDSKHLQTLYRVKGTCYRSWYA